MFSLYWSIFKKTITVVFVLIILGVFYITGINVYSFFRFQPQKVTEDFVSLIENPTSTITDEEKKVLRDISQDNWFTNWSVEDNVKQLRQLANKKPVSISTIDYSGERKNYATVSLNFNNTFTDPECKKATLYLQRYGQWYWQGVRWQVYQIDMPKRAELCSLQSGPGNFIDDLKKGGQDFLDSLKGSSSSNSSAMI